MSDTTAPILHSLSLDHTTLNVGSGETTLLVTAHFSDNLSGISDGVGGGGIPSIWFVSPSGQMVSAVFDMAHPVSGNGLDGFYQARVTLPAGAEAGVWKVQNVWLGDEAGNSSYLTPTNSSMLAATTFTVANGGSDATAPILHSLSLDHTTLNVGSGETTLLVTAHFSDNLSGISDGVGGGGIPSIWFVSPSGQMVSAVFDMAHPVSGNGLDGFYQARVTLPAGAEAGVWKVQNVWLGDEAGNSSYLTPTNSSMLAATTFTVANGGSDATAPILHSLSLDHTTLNVGSGETTLLVTAHFSDNLSGISDGVGGGGIPSIWFVSPSGQMVSAVFDMAHPVSGNGLDGFYQARVTLPAGAEAGVWKVQNVWLGDEAGNSSYLTPTNSSMLAATTFTVANGTTELSAGDDVVLPSSEGEAVLATASTLTSGDRLDGGAGHDVLKLTGAGTYDLNALAQFDGFEEIQLTNLSQSETSLYLRDGQNLKLTLSDGTNTPPQYPMPMGFYVALSTGADTVQGSNGSDRFAAWEPGKLGAGDVLDGGAGSDTLSLSGSLWDSVTGTFADAIYDLRPAHFSNIETLQLSGYNGEGRTIAFVDTTSLAGFTSIYGMGGNTKIRTAESTLDLSGKTIANVAIESTNTAGTTFKVSNVQSALQIAGGVGQDTLVVQGLSLTEAQRTQIFQGSIEAITDSSGTYAKPTLPPGTTELSAGDDVVLPSSEGEAVLATASTLTSGDRLDGGAGHDVLKLTGAGTYDLNALAQFDGFEEIQLTNLSQSETSLYLRDGQNLKLTLSDGTNTPPQYPMPMGFYVALSTGADTVQGSNGSDRFAAWEPGKLGAGDVLDGGAGSDTLSLSGSLWDSVAGTFADAIYDLRPAHFSNIETLQLSGYNGEGRTIAFVDTTSLAGFTSIYGMGGNTKIRTAESTLDLSGKTIANVAIESTNTAGTTFKVSNVQSALQIAGGVGQDTLVVQGLSLTEAQRTQIFQGSIEAITDSSGTYAKPTLPPGTTELSAGDDVVLPSSEGEAVLATASTLTSGDRLDGGAGHDVLKLTGAGTYDLNALAQFDGFEEIQLTNLSQSETSLYLRDGQNLKLTLSDGTNTPPQYPMPMGFYVALSTGADTVQGSNGSDRFAAWEPGKLGAGDVLDGGAGSDTLSLSGSLWDSVTGTFADAIYDLRPAHFSNIETLQLSGYNGEGRTIAFVDTTSLAGFTSIYGMGGNTKIRTAESTLDLSGKTIANVAIESTNTAGTTFKVSNVQSALQIAGGVGQDTLVVQGLSLTEAQRTQIFQGSIEAITDSSGTYTKPVAAVIGNSTSGSEDTTITGQVPAGSDLDGDTLTYELVAPVAGLTFNSDGTFTYVPTAHVNGTTSFEYRVVDAFGLRSAPQSFTLTITPVDDPLTVPPSQSVSTNEDVPAASVAIGAVDLDGDDLSYRLKGGAEPQKGTVSFAGDRFTYTPHENVNGSDSFIITVSDGTTTREQTVTVSINPVSDRATIAGASTGSVAEDGPLATGGTLLVADADPGEAVFKTVAASSLHMPYGSFAFDPTTGAWGFSLNNAAVQTLKAGQEVQQRLMVESLDGTATSAITVTVTGSNDAPTVSAATNVATAEDTPLAGVAIGAADLDGDGLSYSIKGGAGPKHGSVTFDQAHGTFSYRPAANANGSDRFTIWVSDGKGGTAEQVVDVSINPVNDAPANLSLSNAAVLENSPTGTVLGNLSASDLDGDALIYTLQDSAGGRFALTGNQLVVANGALLDYEQASGHSVVVRTTDQGGLSIDQILTITLQDIWSETTAGTSGSDVVVGGSGSDRLSGGEGNDALNSGAGKDVLNGGTGNDRLTGGAGQDTLMGGTGQDVFVFGNKDTSASKKTADYITDFSGRSGDRIDLKGIDADPRKKGDQAFSFIGTNEFTKAGQVRYEKTKKETYVYLNTDNDKSAEAVIKLKGSIDLQKGWFVL